MPKQPNMNQMLQQVTTRNTTAPNGAPREGIAAAPSN